MSNPNYTPSMLATIKGYDSFNKDVAAEIAVKIGKSPRSVIAKIKSLGLPYTVQRPVRKDGSPVSRKAETVAAIAKAPRSALIALLREIP